MSLFVPPCLFLSILVFPYPSLPLSDSSGFCLTLFASSCLSLSPLVSFSFSVSLLVSLYLSLHFTTSPCISVSLLSPFVSSCLFLVLLVSPYLPILGKFHLWRSDSFRDFLTVNERISYRLYHRFFEFRCTNYLMVSSWILSNIKQYDFTINTWWFIDFIKQFQNIRQLSD